MHTFPSETRGCIEGGIDLFRMENSESTSVVLNSPKLEKKSFRIFISYFGVVRYTGSAGSNFAIWQQHAHFLEVAVFLFLFGLYAPVISYISIKT